MTKFQEMYEYDDETRMVTIRSQSGAGRQRPYTAEENAEADERLAVDPETRIAQLTEVVEQLILDQLMGGL